ncbi:MAG: peptidase [Clostridiales bacterium]|jgi:putative protease|nr:peptidase [Clostridiales bacterium]
MKKIELLAPAGSFDALRAAVNAGADAIYVGGKLFSARASANNFDTEELIEAIKFCHLRDKKLYLTVNTLLKQKEIPMLYEYLLPLYENGLDAVIVQDMGVFKYIKTNFPDLPLHASTQMTVQSSDGAKLLEDLGAERVVLSRELSIEEISKIRNENNIEIECFVHGALCYCYSGQCLLSSMIGGRSGNRGRCAQPCRLPFNVINNNKKVNKEDELYMLSPKDICTLEIIPEMVEAGINSFKIEGRMKRAEYVAGVVSIYRKYIDKYLLEGKKNYKVENEDLTILKDLYNRGGFTTGYFKTRNGKETMATIRPNHWGTKIGKIVAKGSKPVIKLDEPINKADVLEVWNTKERVEITTKEEKSSGQTIDIVTRKGVTLVDGAPVYRTKNEKLLNSLEQIYLKNNSKIKVYGYIEVHVEKPIKLTVEAMGHSVTVQYGMAQIAQSRPMTEDKMREQISKTGATSFEFENLEVKVYGDVFISIQELNEVRRLALTELELKIISTYLRNPSQDKIEFNKKSNYSAVSTPNIVVSVMEENQLSTVLKFAEVTQVNFPLDKINSSNLEKITNSCKEANKQLFITMPPVFRLEQQELLNSLNDILKQADFTGFSVKIIDQIEALKEFKKEIATEPGVYVINDAAKLQFEELGIDHFTTSYELNANELINLNIQKFDMVVYGYTPVMVSAQCVNKNSTYCDKKEKLLYLEDRYNKRFMVRNICSGCYNIIYNCQPINLYEYVSNIKDLNPRGLRLDFSVETNEEIRKILKAFTERITHDLQSDFKINDFTRGHYKRGVE